jgi:hypothetical protein
MNDNTGWGPLEGPDAGLFDDYAAEVLITAEQVANVRAKPPDDLEARMQGSGSAAPPAPQSAPLTAPAALERVLTEDAARTAAVAARRSDAHRTPEDTKAMIAVGLAAGETALATIMAANPMCAPVEPLVALDEGALVRRQLTLLVGESGGAKSSLAMGIAFNLARGAALEELAYAVVEGVRVLVLSLEDPQAECNRRIAAMRDYYQDALKAQGVGDRLLVLGEELANLALMGDAEVPTCLVDVGGGRVSLNPVVLGRLRGVLRAFKADVIVLDPLAKLLGPVHQNDLEAQALVAEELVRLAKREDAAVLVVHHVRKGGSVNGQPRRITRDDVKGTGGLVDVSRCLIILQKPEAARIASWQDAEEREIEKLASAGQAGAGSHWPRDDPRWGALVEGTPDKVNNWGATGIPRGFFFRKQGVRVLAGGRVTSVVVPVHYAPPAMLVNADRALLAGVMRRLQGEFVLIATAGRGGPFTKRLHEIIDEEAAKLGQVVAAKTIAKSLVSRKLVEAKVERNPATKKETRRAVVTDAGMHAGGLDPDAPRGDEAVDTPEDT